MTINLITSSIVAGILIFLLAVTNMNIQSSAQELVLSEMKQGQTTDISEIISYDFPKMGYVSIGSIDSTITTANDQKIVFYSNLDNSADHSIEKVTWEFLNIENTATANPNDKILRRQVNGEQTDINIGVVDFRVRYYDVIGSNTPMTTPVSSANLGSIRQIEVEIRLQNADDVSARYNSQAEYITNIWTKRFTPRNLTTNL